MLILFFFLCICDSGREILVVLWYVRIAMVVPGKFMV